MPVRMAYLFKDFTKAMVSMYNKDKNFEEAIEDGMMLDFLYEEGRDKTPVTTRAKQAVDAVVDPSSPARGVATKVWEAMLKANEYSEIGFRMAIRDRVMKEKMRELNKRYPDVKNLTPDEQASYDAEVLDVRAIATAKSREYMDFSTGGSITKSLDPALPYLNAAAVGAFASAKYVKENTGKAALDMLQISAMTTGVFLGGSIAMISALRPDDDDDELDKLAQDKYQKDFNSLTDAQQKVIRPSAASIYLDQYGKLPPFITDRYYIVFTGRINDDGGHEYIKIAKNQGLSPALSLTSDLIINQLAKYEGRDDVYDKADIFLNANRNIWHNYNAFGFNPVDIVEEMIKPNGNVAMAAFSIPAKIVTRNPFVGAAVGVTTNYDFFRNEPIRPKEGKGSLNKYEGYGDYRLEKFYIDLSQQMGGMMKPKDIKYTLEKFVTSPSTNPFVATAYGIGESISPTAKTFSPEIKGVFESIANQTKRRVMGATNPNINSNKIQRIKHDNKYFDEALGKGVAQTSMVNQISKTIAKRLNKDSDYNEMMTDPGLTYAEKNEFSSQMISKLISGGKYNVADYMEKRGIDALRPDQIQKLAGSIDKQLAMDLIDGTDERAYIEAAFSSTPEEMMAVLIRNFHVPYGETSTKEEVLEGKRVYDEFKGEFLKIYSVAKGSRYGKKAQNLPGNFDEIYAEQWYKYNKWLQDNPLN